MNKDDKKIPRPILNKKEREDLKALTKRYDKIISPNPIEKAGKAVLEVIPDKIKTGVSVVTNGVKDTVTEAELFQKCMEIFSNGFETLEKYAAKVSVSEKMVVNHINKVSKDDEISCIDDICFVRGYDISKAVSQYKTSDVIMAAVEGAATGAPGFVGLPFNIVLSTFLFYRAVQSIATYYGYDVKNDAAELEIASEVFISALSPKAAGSNEMGSIICKIMATAEIATVKQTVKKTWADMASRGGLCLLLTQIRALANKAAQKALEKAGKEGLEKSVFKKVLEQIGKKLTKKAIGKSVPAVGAVIGLLFDVSQMNAVLEYADIFYNKRFLLEKEVRVHTRINGDDNVIDASFEDIT